MRYGLPKRSVLPSGRRHRFFSSIRPESATICETPVWREKVETRTGVGLRLAARCGDHLRFRIEGDLGSSTQSIGHLGRLIVR